MTIVRKATKKNDPEVEVKLQPMDPAALTLCGSKQSQSSATQWNS
jgi:hypothetical protein